MGKIDISTYFCNYNNRKSKYCQGLSDETKYCATIKDFYDSFIQSHVEVLFNGHKQAVLDLCKEMKEYTDKSFPIFWVRKWESGGDGEATNDNRRTGKTLLVDANHNPVAAYAYISNYDAQELYNMILSDVDFSDFKKMMENGSYRFHYSLSCSEHKVIGYEYLDDARSLGVMNRAKLYLAHIHDANGFFKSEMYPYDFPKGDTDDWKSIDDWKSDGYSNFAIFDNDTNADHKVRILDTDNDKDDLKEYLKAIFYRFVSPFNYFLVPGVNFEVNGYYGKTKKSIGEYDKLIKYVKCRIYLDYIKKDKDLNDCYSAYENSILIPDEEKVCELLKVYSSYGEDPLHIVFGSKVGKEGRCLELLEKKIKNVNDLSSLFENYDPKRYVFKITDAKGVEISWRPDKTVEYVSFLDKLNNKIGKTKDNYIELIEEKDFSVSKMKKCSSSPKSSVQTYSDDQKLSAAYHFLTHEDSLRKIEKDVLHCTTDRRGATAKSILDSLGIDNKKKNILSSCDIDAEIKCASGKYLDTLGRIKKELLEAGK